MKKLRWPWRESARLIDLRVTPVIASALDYLEAHGQQFLVDHGWQNALDKATDMFISSLEKASEP